MCLYGASRVHNLRARPATEGASRAGSEAGERHAGEWTTCAGGRGRARPASGAWSRLLGPALPTFGLSHYGASWARPLRSARLIVAVSGYDPRVRMVRGECVSEVKIANIAKLVAFNQRAFS